MIYTRVVVGDDDASRAMIWSVVAEIDQGAKGRGELGYNRG